MMSQLAGWWKAVLSSLAPRGIDPPADFAAGERIVQEARQRMAEIDQRVTRMLTNPGVDR